MKDSLPTALTFVDIETTGLSPVSDRIIEIAILRVENNKLTEEFTSLINPSKSLPKEIVKITGITDDQLVRAPYFDELKPKIKDILSDSVFVAHNARFDYGFVKNEFIRHEDSFNAKTLCTVRLTRRLYPGLPSYGLDSIIRNLGLDSDNRHRALGDAKVLWHLYQKIQLQHSPKKLISTFNFFLSSPSLPQHLTKSEFDNIPNAPGVYKFLGEDDVVLYIGKSVNLKDRVRSHFNADYQSPTDIKIARDIRRIDTIAMAGELSALLKESNLIKTLQPIHNKKLRKSSDLIYAKKSESKNKYFSLILSTINSLQSNELNNTMAIFKNKNTARNSLYDLASEFNLCPKLLGIEKGKGSCFNYQIGKCSGACTAQENPLSYNMRFSQAFANLKIRPWPFPGEITITESYEELSETHNINNWCISESENSFDYDIYKILKKFIFNEKNSKKIALSNYISPRAWLLCKKSAT